MSLPQTVSRNLFAKARPLVGALCLTIFILLSALSFPNKPATVEAATSSTLNFQARLLNSTGSTVPDGYYNLEFNLYSAGTGGSSLWSEAYYDTNGATAGNDFRVRVVNGYFSVNLGSQTAFPGTINWDQEHWLTMNVGGSTQTSTPTYDGEMSPRLKLTAVPYAFSAGQLRKTLGVNTSILDFLNPTANRTLNLPDQDGTLCVQGSPDCVDVNTTGTTAVTSSNSGLEIAADGLRLLGGCSDGQMMTWNDTSEEWECSSGSGSSFIARESDGSSSTTVSNALEFGPSSNSDTEFIISNEGGGVARVRIGTSILTTGNYGSTLDATYVNSGEAPAAGDVSGSFAAGLSVNDVQNNAVDLGAETVGDYVQNLGTLVGLSTSGNTGEGSTPGLSVLYGSSANTAVQGNTQLTCPSGGGDLSGGGTVITLGAGGTCGAITISEAPVFDTSVTTPLLTYSGALTIQTTATGGADDLIFKTAGTEVMRLLENGNIYLEKGTNDVTIAVNTPGAPATYTFDGATGTVLTTANYATNLDATYVNSGEAPAAGDVSGSFAAGLSVNDVQNNAVDLGAETVGDYVQNLGTLVGLSTSGNTGEGSTPGLSVLYGSSANTAAAGSNTFTCTSGTGNLTGGGTVVTVGTSGTTCAAITTNDAVSFATSVTSPLFKNAGGLLTIESASSGGTDDIVFNTAGTERLRLLESGGLSVVGNVSVDGALSDPTGNLTLDDIVDIGSAANGLRVGTDGSLVDIDGALVLNDDLNLGSATTGLLVTIDGAVTDLDDASVTFGENVTVSAGGLTVTGNSTVTGTLVTYSTGYNVFAADADLRSYGYFRSVYSNDSLSRFEFGAYDLTGASQGGRALVLNPLGGNVGVGGDLTPDALFSVGSTSQFQVDTNGLVVSVGINAGTGLIQGTGGLTITGVTSLDGALSDPTGNLTLDDITDIGSATTGLQIGTDGSLIDIDGNLVLNDQLALGSSTTGLLITTDGVITDIDDASVAFGESIAVTGNALIQQTATGAAIMIDRTDGVIASLKSGLAKSGFFFDSAGSFGIAFDTRANIASGTGAGTDVLTALATGSIGIGTIAPDSRLHVVGGGLCVETADSGCLAASGTATIGSGLLILAGGANITGGIDNNIGGITEAGAISGATTINASGLITGTDGLAITGDIVNLNVSSNFAVNIGTGTSTGAVTIGGGSNTFAIASTGLDISTAGAITNAPSIASVTNTNLTLDAAGTGSLVFTGYNCSTQSNGGALTTNASGVVACSADDAGISDSRLKKNVTSLDDNILDKLKDVRTVTFDFDCDQQFFDERVLDCLTTRQTGVIAQELAEVFPELVYQAEDGYYRVKYDALSIYNLKAVTEIAKHISSDGGGNFNTLTVNGVLEAGTIRADKIEGLDYIGRFESLEARVSSLEQQSTTNTEPQSETQPHIDLENLTAGNFTATGSATLNGATVIKGEAKFENKAAFTSDVIVNGQTDLEGLTVHTGLIAEGTIEVNGEATFKEMARFEKDANFQGKITVAGQADLQQLTVNLDLIARGSLLVEGPATFKEMARFEKDAVFEGSVAVKGQATFNNDTAGNITIKQGETTAKVTFKKPKDRKPIITLTLGDGKFAQYSYRNVTEQDFEIVLAQPATEDLTFSWVAILTEQEVSIAE